METSRDKRAHGAMAQDPLPKEIVTTHGSRPDRISSGHGVARGMLAGPGGPMRSLFPALLATAALSSCLDDRPEHTPHADFVRDLEPVAFPERQLPPPTPLRAPSDRPDVAVYGYWPYWGDALSTLYWDQLTHVAIFSVGLNADGTLNNTSRWTNHAATALSYAAPYGVKVHLVLTSFDDAVNNAVLPSASRRATAVAALANLVNSYGAHGVNLDIEGMDASQRNNLVTFVRELDAVVDEVTLATPAVDWSSAYDYATLAAEADLLFIMGYDYHWGGGNPGPIGPLYGGGIWATYSLDWTVRDYLAKGAPASKLVLGLPLYGRDWPSVSTAVPGVRNGTSTAVLYATSAVTGPSYGRRWDATTHTPYAFPSATNQLWYDDLESIEDKAAYAVDGGLGGIGFWALTYEDSDPAFWTMVDGLTHTACPDSDGDGTSDCDDGCPADPGKTTPGVCGCGVADTDSDGDGFADCIETCDDDPAKQSPGVCGCGTPDTDTDGDAWLDCQETCDDDPLKQVPGVCGCGVPDDDSDADGALDCVETCDDDPDKVEPGVCGCGLPDEDLTGDGVPDCVVCGDGVVEAPEACDDGARASGDGCSAVCAVEPLTVDAPAPGVAGVTNTVVARHVPFGHRILYVASTQLGSTPVPGCPGVTVPLRNPALVGVGMGGSAGTATLAVRVPPAAAGRSFALLAVDLDRCMVSAPVAAQFR